MKFDGVKVREQILKELKVQSKKAEKDPILAVIWIGNNLVSKKYIELKKKVAEKVGIKVQIIHYQENAKKERVEKIIERLNKNQNVFGIMIQMPLPDGYDRDKLINLISPKKDVDGLRFCASLDSDFLPPVILAIIEAIKISGKEISKSKVAIVGKGFLVGTPIFKLLSEQTKNITLSDSKSDISASTRDADIIISATGVANLIKPEMIKKGAVLIDAGTSDIEGRLVGDIDSTCFEKAEFYSPVPGGIGPVTVAMLMKNTKSVESL